MKRSYLPPQPSSPPSDDSRFQGHGTSLRSDLESRQRRQAVFFPEQSHKSTQVRDEGKENKDADH